MTYTQSDAFDAVQTRGSALARWDNEGGACPGKVSSADDRTDEADPGTSSFTSVELSQLKARVIALENLTVSLLSGVSGKQFDAALEMAHYIASGPRHKPDLLTLQTATQMVSLIECARHLRATPHAPEPLSGSDVLDKHTLP
jgi:hypothetical protein